MSVSRSEMHFETAAFPVAAWNRWVTAM